MDYLSDKSFDKVIKCKIVEFIHLACRVFDLTESIGYLKVVSEQVGDFKGIYLIRYLIMSEFKVLIKSVNKDDILVRIFLDILTIRMIKEKPVCVKKYSYENDKRDLCKNSELCKFNEWCSKCCRGRSYKNCDKNSKFRKKFTVYESNSN